MVWVLAAPCLLQLMLPEGWQMQCLSAGHAAMMVLRLQQMVQLMLRAGLPLYQLGLVEDVSVVGGDAYW